MYLLVQIACQVRSLRQQNEEEKILSFRLFRLVFWISVLRFTEEQHTQQLVLSKE